MLNNKKRIFNIEGYLSRYLTDNDFYIGVSAKDVPDILLKRAGLTLEVGKRVVPLRVGPISKYNAIGKVVKLKNQPKEYVSQRRKSRKTGTYIGTWHYWRWQRESLPPLKEFIETVLVGDEILLISKPLEYKPENEAINCHIVNLFLEIFGMAGFYTRGLVRMQYEPKTRSVEWDFFPEGTSLTEKKNHILAIAEEKEKRGIPNYKSNLEVLETYGPEDIAVGSGGFGGYFAYIYPERDIVMVESPDYGNATYVLPYSNWEELSQLTKGEVVDGRLCKMRIPHDEYWAYRVQKLMVE